MSTEQVQTLDAGGDVRGFKLYVIYDTGTGQILKYGRAPRDTLEDGGASMAAQADVGQGVLAVSEWPAPNLSYVPGGMITGRPVTPVTPIVAGRVVTLSGVPLGAVYTVMGDASLSGVAADTTLALTFGYAGTFRVRVSYFPNQDFIQDFTLP